jgi:hypothetical protein
MFDISVVFFEHNIWSVDVLFMNVKEYELTKLVGCWTTYEFTKCKEGKLLFFIYLHLSLHVLAMQLCLCL